MIKKLSKRKKFTMKKIAFEKKIPQISKDTGVQKSFEEIMKKYDRVFRKLAKT